MSNSIIIRLAGGLGNQLFQIAAGAHIARITGRELCAWTASLGRYAEKREPASLQLLGGLNIRTIDTESKMSETLIDKLRLGRFPFPFSVNDRNFSPLRDEYPRALPLILDGYFQKSWQSSDFEPVRTQLMTSISVPFSAPIEAACGIHVRGGDFKGNPIHHILGDQYYTRCVSLMLSRGAKNFVVISDDATYSRDVLKPATERIAAAGGTVRLGQQGNGLMDDFAQLMACQTRIIGNSTFAWWATALDPKGGFTLSPNKFIATDERQHHLPWEEMVGTDGPEH